MAAAFYAERFKKAFNDNIANITVSIEGGKCNDI